MDEGVEVTKTSTMVTNDISAKLLDETTKSLVVLATRDIIDGYTLVEHGILYSANTAYGLEGAEDTMIVGASGVAKGISTSTATTGTYAHTITLTEEAEDRAEQARLVYELIKYESEDSLRARCIDAIVENQQLKEDNAKLRESLRKAYDFMEKMVIDGRNMLERFMESLSETVVRTIDKVRGELRR